MLRLFERFVKPFPPEHPQQPPQGLYAFCRHYTRGLEWPLLTMSVLTALMATLEVTLFSFMGELVDWLVQKTPDTLLQEEGWRLGLMAITLVVILPTVVFFACGIGAPDPAGQLPHAHPLAGAPLSAEAKFILLSG